MSTISPNTCILCFDVEAVGLYGNAFAAGGILCQQDGTVLKEWYLSCPPETAFSPKDIPDDREWVKIVVSRLPDVPPNCANPTELYNRVYQIWRDVYQEYEAMGIEVLAVADCLYPVEANLFIHAIKLDPLDRKYKGPYPFHEVATAMLMANMKTEDYPRLPSEEPEHDPTKDARYSARLFAIALQKTASLRQSHSVT